MCIYLYRHIFSVELRELCEPQRGMLQGCPNPHPQKTHWKVVTSIGNGSLSHRIHVWFMYIICLFIYCIYTISWNPNDPCFGRKRRCFVGLAYIDIEVMWVPGICMSVYTLLGTNISPPKVCLKMIFFFPRWDMLVSWRGYLDVYIYMYAVCIKCMNITWKCRHKYTTLMDLSQVEIQENSFLDVSPSNR